MRQSKGFTLVELIVVILLLGIVSIATFSYLGFGAQIFQDVTGRDTLTAQSRFAVERLSREVRNALPASIRVSNDEPCLEFMPIETGSSYLHLPTSGNTSNTMIGVLPHKPFPDHNLQDVYLFVYANSEDRIYAEDSTQRRQISDIRISLIGSEPPKQVREFEFTTDDLFTFQSPAKRYYISTGPVSWCVDNSGQLLRVDGYGIHKEHPSLNSILNLGNPVTMATGLTSMSYFDAEHSTLQRNNLVAFRFYFTRRNGAEPLTVYHEVQVTNVP